MLHVFMKDLFLSKCAEQFRHRISRNPPEVAPCGGQARGPTLPQGLHKPRPGDPHCPRVCTRNWQGNASHPGAAVSLALHALHGRPTCLQLLTTSLATPLQRPPSCELCRPHTHLLLACSI